MYASEVDGESEKEGQRKWWATTKCREISKFPSNIFGSTLPLSLYNKNP